MDRMVKNGTDGKNGFPFVPLNYFTFPSFAFVTKS